MPITYFTNHSLLPCRLIFVTLLGLLLFSSGIVAETSDPLRLEAEKFKLTGFITENNANASGRKVIRSVLAENVYAEAETEFKGKSGYYDLVIHYFDESDGVSGFKLWCGSKWVDNWKACRDFDNDGTGPDNLVSRKVTRIRLNRGDKIKIAGYRNQGEYGRIDCIDLFFLGEQLADVPDREVEKERFIPFKLDQQGFVRTWQTLGPILSPVNQDLGNEKEARTWLLSRLRSPEFIKLERVPRITSSGDAWELYSGGQNVFVETYRFFYNLTASDYYGLTYLSVPVKTKVKARLWSTRGKTQVWCRGRLVAERVQASGTKPSFVDVELPLEAGINPVIVRQWDLGARNTPQLFGLQLLDGAEQVEAGLFGNEQTEAFFEAEEWLYSVKLNSSGNLEAAKPAPLDAFVQFEKEKRRWAAGERSFSFSEGETPFQLNLVVNLDDTVLVRKVENPRYYPYHSPITADTLSGYRREYLRLLLPKEQKSLYGLIIKAVLGEKMTNRDQILKTELARIDSRADCSDFYLSAILRLYRMGGLTPEEQQRVRKTVLEFRYWTDESGTDAMSMSSENHQLLFHGCQLLAGNLLPEERFKRSGRKGKEQARIAKERLNRWLSRVEQRGFEEFLSSAYVPITMGGLLNLVDFADDPDISRRAGKLVDSILIQLAQHSFDGVTSGPQGRVYRDGALYPRNSGTQAILSYVTPKAKLSLNPWVSFLASSRYTIPSVDQWLDQPIDLVYPQGGTVITLRKTADYAISSATVPSPSGGKEYWPGALGTQEHLCDINLGDDTHIFLNHPGASYETSQSRPGYWNGNGVLPTLKQKGSTMMAIFDIPESYPIQFTHAYWPADQFDQEEKYAGWSFARKGDAYIGLWCSRPTMLTGDMVMGRELRANGRKTAWVAVVSSQAEAGSFETFIHRCRAMAPRFDSEAKALWVDGEVQLQSSRR